MTAVSGDDLFLVGWDDASFLKVPEGAWGMERMPTRLFPLCAIVRHAPFQEKGRGGIRVSVYPFSRTSSTS